MSNNKQLAFTLYLLFPIQKFSIDVFWLNLAYYQCSLSFKAINKGFYLFLFSYEVFIPILLYLLIFFDLDFCAGIVYYR